MPAYPLNDRQKELLTSLKPYLLEEAIEMEWAFFYGDDQIMGIMGLDRDGKLWNESWKGVTRADFSAFARCGFFERSTTQSYILNAPLILQAIDDHFTYPAPNMRKLYLSPDAKAAGRYLSSAWGNRWITSYIVCADAGYDETRRIQVIPVSGVLEKDQFVMPPIEDIKELTGLVDVVQVGKHWQIQINSSLHEAVDNAFHVRDAAVQVDQSTNVSMGPNAIFAPNSTLSHITQHFNQVDHLPENFKDELAQLLDQLKDKLNALPEQDASELAEVTDNLVKTISDPNASKRKIKWSLDLFRSAYQDVGLTLGLVATSPEIATLTGSIVKLVASHLGIQM